MLYEVILSNLFPVSDLYIIFFLSAAPDLFKKKQFQGFSKDRNQNIAAYNESWL